MATKINYFANKGMFIEDLVDKTIFYYLDNKICFIEKRYMPIKIIKRKNDLIEGKLLKKSYVDYFGLIKSKFVSFETKQTDNDYFLLNQIKDHQLNHLKDISLYGGIAFVILHFYNSEATFLIPYCIIEQWVANNIKKVDLTYLKKCLNDNKVFNLEIIFPGILNIYDVVDKKIIS
ncbi:MAG: Holliday junction resolvase RecU [Malacoplasma sp.]|nr:Holliday junction resolvase RecU [Malacoplasma sp.]